MSFGRWVEQAPCLPECGIIAKTPHANRFASLPAELQYAAAELFRGTFARHKLIAYRSDHYGDSQAITFVGDRWREYVPIRLLSTVCVRERLPPGSVAVLINRAHQFTDLLLLVDKLEDRLLSAIDGERTLSEILIETGNDHNEQKALRFFERLWQYDQIVFDASSANRLSMDSIITAWPFAVAMFGGMLLCLELGRLSALALSPRIHN